MLVQLWLSFMLKLVWLFFVEIEISNIRFNVYVLALRCIVFMCVDNGQMASREQYLSKKHMFANL